MSKVHLNKIPSDLFRDLFSDIYLISGDIVMFWDIKNVLWQYIKLYRIYPEYFVANKIRSHQTTWWSLSGQIELIWGNIVMFWDITKIIMTTQKIIWHNVH